MLNKLSIHRRFVVTGMLIVFSLGFLGFFQESDNVNPALQGFIVSLIFFLVIPVLYSKMVLKESLKNIGWQQGNALAGILAGTGCVMLGTVISFFLIKLTPFREYYSLPGLAGSDFLWFMLYEVVLVSLVAFLYEMFFRGLIQLLWLRDFGFSAVLVQTGFFFLMFFLSGGFSWHNAPLFIFAPLAGIIAHVSRSIWYSWAASWFFFFLTDVLVLSIH